jgi:hypothetical protein
MEFKSPDRSEDGIIDFIESKIETSLVDVNSHEEVVE